MSITDKEDNILRMILRLGKEDRDVTPTMVSDGLGFDCCARIVDESKSLEKLGLIKRVRVHHSRMLLSLTKTGRDIATLLPEIAIYGHPNPDDGRRLNKVYSGRPVMLDRNDPGLSVKPCHWPEPIIGDESRRVLYRGARYENYKGFEIVDRTPIPASRALEGYGGSEVT